MQVVSTRKLNVNDWEKQLTRAQWRLRDILRNLSDATNAHARYSQCDTAATANKNLLGARYADLSASAANRIAAERDALAVACQNYLAAYGRRIK